MKSQERLCRKNYTTQIKEGNRDLPINSRLEQFILENGRVDLGMVTGNNSGLMELSMWVSGERIELMERVGLSTWMEIYMMGSGLMIRQMELALINMSMEHNMRENGKMIFNMEKV